MLLLNGDTIPHLIIQCVLPSENHTIQKLFLIYLEIINKTDSKKKFKQWAPIGNAARLGRSIGLRYRSKCSSTSSGHVRAQLVMLEQASIEEAKIVEGLVVVVIGASRGIGGAIALSLCKAGYKSKAMNLSKLLYGFADAT
ncbi:hypothetical protein EV2_039477 [Malus domestica]